MNRNLSLLAAVVSVAAIYLALDPGRFAFAYVDSGGHSLRMLISGHGSPAVVFETGGSTAAGGPLEAWERVQPAVSKFATTVSYDRAGIGRSAPGPKPRDARQVARELHTALHNAHVSPPYVLVGHSLGGPLNRVFAATYPEEVGGMVLVDPTQEDFLSWNQTRDPNHQERQDEEWKDIQASLVEARESQVPLGIPVILITATKLRMPPDVSEKQKEEMKAVRSAWLKFHLEWLERIPNGRHIVTENSGHVVPFEEPQLVIEAIHQVVGEIKNGHKPDGQ
jgi:pimeloyl-ACP methyl ester carboxylesterase